MHINTRSFDAGYTAKFLQWALPSCFGKNEDRESFYAALDEWAAGGEHGEQRDIAARRIRDAFDRGTDYVNVAGLGLKTWPPLPPVRMVDISKNALTQGPGHCPESVEKIVASDNQITEITHLSSFVTHIDFRRNAIEKVCDLPGLEYAYFQSNKLRTVPVFSVGAKEVNLAYNDIDDVRQDEWPAGCRFFLSGEALRNVRTRTTLTEYPDMSRKNRQEWCDILHGSEKDDAKKFFMFLKKIRTDFNVEVKEMWPDLAVWLDRLPKSRMFRKEIFDLAIAGPGANKNDRLQTLKRIEMAFSRNAAGPEACEKVQSWFPNGELLKNVRVRRTMPLHSELSWKAREKWCEIDYGRDHEKVGKFFTFLRRFHNSFNVKMADVRPDMTVWVERLANSDTLRDEIFDLAAGGIATVGTRGVPTFKQMERALARDEGGKESYNPSLPWLPIGKSLKDAMLSSTLPRYRGITPETREKWCEILFGSEKEKGEQFIAFLAISQQALNLSPEDIHWGCANWLEQLANCDTLRERIFSLAVDGLRNADGDPLQVLKAIESALVRGDGGLGEYDNPRLLFLNGEGLENVILLQALPCRSQLSPAARKKWCEILSGGEKRDAEQFFVFLGKLRAAMYMEPAEFNKGVTVWLERLADRGSDTLRGETFALGISGLGDCKDRVLIEFKQMETALIRDDIRQGKLEDPAEIIAMARQIFRFEELRNFAGTLGAVMGSKEELEKELGLILALSQRLGLHTKVQKMHYSKTAALTDTNVNDAEEWVQNAENQRFRAWLSTWPAWNDAVQRAEPALFGNAEEKWQSQLALPEHKSAQAIVNEIKGADYDKMLRETKAMTDKLIQKELGKRDTAFAEMYGCADDLTPLWDPLTRLAVRSQMEPRKPLLHMLGTRFENKKARRN